MPIQDLPLETFREIALLNSDNPDNKNWEQILTADLDEHFSACVYKQQENTNNTLAFVFKTKIPFSNFAALKTYFSLMAKSDLDKLFCQFASFYKNTEKLLAEKKYNIAIQSSPILCTGYEGGAILADCFLAYLGFIDTADNDIAKASITFENPGSLSTINRVVSELFQTRTFNLRITLEYVQDRCVAIQAEPNLFNTAFTQLQQVYGLKEPAVSQLLLDSEKINSSLKLILLSAYEEEYSKAVHNLNHLLAHLENRFSLTERSNHLSDEDSVYLYLSTLRQNFTWYTYFKNQWNNSDLIRKNYKDFFTYYQCKQTELDKLLIKIEDQQETSFTNQYVRSNPNFLFTQQAKEAQNAFYRSEIRPK